ncbi:hypothetical protein PPERSA_04453 [Pseudocohnilembus persalinus]|uniref:Uncharacterized protein n=1 Tax=Pseudocohnilembus persalinus TaxID=266149 RepID=A0A0V0QQP2_PSEPJ|nr:hypothetical protein PPERSA_04453 [Pseudocohnilembus persalinus]|eukprot:KRX04638.1 hypothetical protein PPERSA_04453 [Pseudocohnilembus persalinus]
MNNEQEAKYMSTHPNFPLFGNIIQNTNKIEMEKFKLQKFKNQDGTEFVTGFTKQKQKVKHNQDIDKKEFKQIFEENYIHKQNNTTFVYPKKFNSSLNIKQENQFQNENKQEYGKAIKPLNKYKSQEQIQKEITEFQLKNYLKDQTPKYLTQNFKNEQLLKGAKLIRAKRSSQNSVMSSNNKTYMSHTTHHTFNKQQSLNNENNNLFYNSIVVHSAKNSFTNFPNMNINYNFRVQERIKNINVNNYNGSFMKNKHTRIQSMHLNQDKANDNKNQNGYSLNKKQNNQNNSNNIIQRNFGSQTQRYFYDQDLQEESKNDSKSSINQNDLLYNNSQQFHSNIKQLQNNYQQQHNQQKKVEKNYNQLLQMQQFDILGNQNQEQLEQNEFYKVQYKNEINKDNEKQQKKFDISKQNGELWINNN